MLIVMSLWLPHRIRHVTDELHKRRVQEEREAQALETMVHSVEQNLQLMTVRTCPFLLVHPFDKDEESFLFTDYLKYVSIGLQANCHDWLLNRIVLRYEVLIHYFDLFLLDRNEQLRLKTLYQNSNRSCINYRFDLYWCCWRYWDGELQWHMIA